MGCYKMGNTKIRPTKKQYLLNIAKAVSARATCPDMAVGCVIATKDGHILSTGYNGVPSGEKHCKIRFGKCLENDRFHRVVHAEQNAIVFAAKQGIKLDSSVAYITHRPCHKCVAMLKQAGIIKVFVCEENK